MVSHSHYTVHPTTTRIDLDVQAGDSIDLIVPILDGDSQPVALDEGQAAQWSARATVRRNVFSATALHEWTTAGGAANASIVAGAEAAVRLTASATETAAWVGWPVWVCGWDLDVTPPDLPLSPHRIAAGRFRLLPEYTR